MHSRLKLWVGLGAFTLVQAGVVPTVDVDVDGKAGTLGMTAALPAAWAAGGGEGGEGGGEGGEAGINAEQVGEDPVQWLVALDVIAAHFAAGRDAYARGDRHGGAEMFAHPLGEVYVEIEPALKARGAKLFQTELERAGTLALENAPLPKVDSAVKAVYTALDRAAAKAPPSDRSAAAVQAAVITDMLDRSARQYVAAAKTPEAEPYLDGYGFLQAAQRRAKTALPKVAAADPAAGQEIRKALALLAKAYPSVARPKGALGADQVALLAQASAAKLAVSHIK